MTNLLPKIWLMRQAGRYLPEYQEIKAVASDFLSLCYNPEWASEVTLQPLKRFDLDAAIVFADILLIADNLGLNLSFEKGIGPKLSRVTSMEDYRRLRTGNNKLPHVYETISKVRGKLDKNKKLIGFAGSPWTVATYILEGQSKSDFIYSKKAAYNNEEFLNSLIDLLVEQTIDYLLNQIAAGADIIQLFDSWAGVLAGSYYDKYVVQPNKKIILAIKSKYPNIPIIGFPRKSGFLYNNYIKECPVDIISVDETVPLHVIRDWQEKNIVQGNLDPTILLTNKEIIAKNVDKIFTHLDPKKLIFNLGHGVLPVTPVENVKFLVEYVNQKFASIKDI